MAKSTTKVERLQELLEKLEKKKNEDENHVSALR